MNSVVYTCLLIGAAISLPSIIIYYRRRLHALEAMVEEFGEERFATLSLMNRIAQCFNNSLDLEQPLQIITEYIVESTRAEAGAIFLIEPDGKSLRARAVSGMFPPLHQTSEHVVTKRKYLAEWIKRDVIQIGEGIIGFVANSGEPLLISDALSDPRVPNVSTDFLKISSMIATPLRTRQKVLGVFAVVNKRITDSAYGQDPSEQTFQERDLKVLRSLADQAAMTVDLVRLCDQLTQQQRIEQELRLAQEFQQMLLPQHCPQIEGFDIAAYSKPAREVGGDYYDFLWVDPEHLGIAIVDVSGKGIPGAFVMAILRSALRAEAVGRYSPKEVLRHVNAHIREDTKRHVFVTVTYGIIDIRTGRIVFARAGHEPLLTCSPHEDEPRSYTPPGIALGLVDDATFDLVEEMEVALQDGDTAVLYTDGVVEAMNENLEEYGVRRFHTLLGQIKDRKPQEQIDEILDDIQRFTKDIPQNDDITLLVFRYNNTTPSETARIDDGKTAEPVVS
jgi:sigma-B regulation protein RsbU (phosphoserine phosphatase)